MNKTRNLEVTERGSIAGAAQELGGVRRKAAVLPILFSVLFCSSCMQGGNEASGPMAYSDEVKAVLGRGVVSTPGGRHPVRVSWRLLPQDPPGVSFMVYRKRVGEGDEKYQWIARTEKTAITVREPHADRYSYAVRPSHNGKEGTMSRESIALASVGGKPALVIDVGQPCQQARVVTGDLNGDGEPEIVVAYSAYHDVDPYERAWSKSEDTIKVAAFLPTGDRLWTQDLGWGIEAGAEYQPMVVWDLDGDGRAEVILKTNRSGDPLNYSGERVTVLDGTSGEVKQEAKWPSVPWSPTRKSGGELPGIATVAKGLWSEYNNDSRNFLAIAHLDGRDPYVIAARGTYKSQKLWAFDKTLRRIWERNLGLDHIYAEGFPYTPMSFSERVAKFWHRSDKIGYLRARLARRSIMDRYRGSHSLPVADLDEDGKEELLWGERCIGEDGTDLWAIEEKIPYPGHPDVVFPADVLPSRKGKEVFFTREGGTRRNEKIGAYLVDYRGKIIWAHWGYHHIDKGWVGKISDEEGMQAVGVDLVDKQERTSGPWTLIGLTAYLWNAEGKLLGNPPVSWYASFPVDWDGDGIREIVIMKDGNIQKFGGPVVEQLNAECLWGADLYGDHREEIVAAPGDGRILIFFNADPPDHAPRVTPLADRQYRNDLSRTATQSTVIPTEGGYIPRKSER